MSPKYAQHVQQPLAEIIAERRGFYEAQVEKAFDVVYQCKDFSYIESFEREVINFCERAMNPIKGQLESRVETEKPKRRTRRVRETETESDISEDKVDNKPRLTWYQYQKARNQGMSSKAIKLAYRVSSKSQLRSFGQKYSHMQRDDSRPVLNYELYKEARDKDMTNEQIKKEYRLANSKQLSGLNIAYLRWESKKKTSKRKPKKKN